MSREEAQPRHPGTPRASPRWAHTGSSPKTQINLGLKAPGLGDFSENFSRSFDELYEDCSTSVRAKAENISFNKE